jgi:hypothetical protein
LREDVNTSQFIDDISSYDFLYQAACEFVRLTGCLTAEQAITTVASTRSYDLNADFISLYMVNDRNDYFAKINDGATDYFFTHRDYDSSYYANLTDDTALPNTFSIRNKQSLATPISALADANGALTLGTTALKDASALFATVSSGDRVHNVTDGSDGIVLSKDTSSQLTTALFGGTLNYWTSGDTYVIVPSARKQLVLESPSLTSGYIITVPYIKRPDPVYSDYGSYNIDPQYVVAIVKYAAWLYKYRDSQPNFGDQWYKHWDMEVRRAKSFEKKIRKTVNIRVNFLKRSMYDRSFR